MLLHVAAYPPLKLILILDYKPDVVLSNGQLNPTCPVMDAPNNVVDGLENVNVDDVMALVLLVLSIKNNSGKKF